jgi:hypothetical protein
MPGWPLRSAAGGGPGSLPVVFDAAEVCTIVSPLLDLFGGERSHKRRVRQRCQP